jgi:hypothetical protein
MHCPEGERHSLSTIFLATPEGCLKALLHDPFGKIAGLLLLFLFYILYISKIALQMNILFNALVSESVIYISVEMTI